ncbi:hypothetical protein BJX61DRAFT_502068 [Aspergillus egyptiacus]|nr:hypothetical protein BJX61DRAFT_502068 [Aspergillus egyptiacus]
MDPTHVVVDRKMLVSLVVERTQALLRCLEVAIEKGEPGRECVQILLPAYLECAAGDSAEGLSAVAGE